MSWSNSPEDLIESAWRIISNVHWEQETPGWQEAANAWKDRYYSYLWTLDPLEETPATGLKH